MQYANIVNGVVNIIEVDPKKIGSLRGAGLTLIDIKGIKPKPGKGWLYDGESFSEPEKLKKKKRSKKDFFSQLSSSEIRAIQDGAKTDDDLNAWLFRLNINNAIDYQESLDLLVSKSIIDQAKADSMK